MAGTGIQSTSARIHAAEGMREALAQRRHEGKHGLTGALGTAMGGAFRGGVTGLQEKFSKENLLRGVFGDVFGQAMAHGLKVKPWTPIFGKQRVDKKGKKIEDDSDTELNEALKDMYGEQAARAHGFKNLGGSDGMGGGAGGAGGGGNSTAIVRGFAGVVTEVRKTNAFLDTLLDDKQGFLAGYKESFVKIERFLEDITKAVAPEAQSLKEKVTGLLDSAGKPIPSVDVQKVSTEPSTLEPAKEEPAATVEAVKKDDKTLKETLIGVLTRVAKSLDGLSGKATSPKQLEKDYEDALAKKGKPIVVKSEDKTPKKEGGLLDKLLGMLGLNSLKGLTIEGLLGGLAKALLHPVGIMVAAFAGYKFGEWLNDTFKISDKFLNAIDSVKEFITGKKTGTVEMGTPNAKMKAKTAVDREFGAGSTLTIDQYETIKKKESDNKIAPGSTSEAATRLSSTDYKKRFGREGGVEVSKPSKDPIADAVAKLSDKEYEEKFGKPRAKSLTPTTPVSATTTTPVVVPRMDKQKMTEVDGLGSLSAEFEGKVDSANKDNIGHAYGKYQFNSSGKDGGGLGMFMKANPQIAAKFEGLQPGTPEFAAKWKEEAKLDPKGFEAAQDKTAQTKWYAPAAEKATKLGFKTDNRGVQEAIFSGSIQHGKINKVLEETAATPGFKDMSPEEQTKTFYTTRRNYIQKLGLGDKVTAQQMKRYDKEEPKAIKLAMGEATTVPERASPLTNKNASLVENKVTTATPNVDVKPSRKGSDLMAASKENGDLQIASVEQKNAAPNNIVSAPQTNIKNTTNKSMVMPNTRNDDNAFDRAVFGRIPIA